MEHGAADDYLDSRKLNIDCKKAIEETIREHFDGMRLSPVYQQTLQYAMEHGAADDYLDSRKLNIDCKKAIEETIREHFDGMRLSLEDNMQWNMEQRMTI